MSQLRMLAQQSDQKVNLALNELYDAIVIAGSITEEGCKYL